MGLRVMELDQALDTIAQRGLFLCYDARNGVDLWTPMTPVPITLRRAVYRYRDVLAELMHDGDARLCPSRQLHRRYFRYDHRERKTYCELCKRIELSMARSA